MKVLVINEFTRGSSGTDRVVNDHLLALQNKKINHKIFSYNHVEFDTTTIFNKIQILFDSLFSKLKINELSKILTDYKPDIIHIHNLYPFLFRTINILNKYDGKVIFHIHNYYPFCINSYFYINKGICTDCVMANSWTKAIVRRCYADSLLKTLFVVYNRPNFKNLVKTLNYVNTFVAVSDFVKKKYCEYGFPEEKIAVIKNSVPSDLYKEKYVHKFGDYVLFIGSLVFQKGIDHFLEVASCNKNIPFIVAGDGKDRGELIKKYKGYNNIKFIGVVNGNSKKDFFANSRFVVVPSLWWETFGLIVLEANSYGKMVISTGLGGLSEIIIDGKNGFLYKHDDLFSLEKLINKLWYEEDLIGKRNLCIEHSKIYNHQKFSTQILNLYSKLIS